MKLNIKTADGDYAQALALTLARCLNADVAIDADTDFDADYNLCDDGSVQFASGELITISKFEPVSKLVARLRSRMIEKEGMPAVNIKAVSVTGKGGSGVSTVASIGASIAGELFDKTVLLVSFSAIGGPSERQVYDLLTKGAPEPGGLIRDHSGVIRLEGEKHLNPLGRLSRREAAEILERLGHMPGPDYIVLDVPIASPHWSLCVKAAETVVVVGPDAENEIEPLVRAETGGINRILRFENRREEGKPDMFSETGAAIRRFVQEAVC